MPVRLAIFDCDRTLWDHEDVSSLQLPYHRLDTDSVADAQGVPVRLFPGVRDVLAELRGSGVLCSIASWNRPEAVLPIFELLDLRVFTRPKIEFHPHKDRMVAALLDELRTDGVTLQPEEILFVDDRADHLARVRRAVGPIRILQAGVDYADFREILTRVR